MERYPPTTPTTITIGHVRFHEGEKSHLRGVACIIIIGRASRASKVYLLLFVLKCNLQNTCLSKGRKGQLINVDIHLI